jgi:hypothetical protein
VALALTVSVVVLAHDVSRLSSQSNANRASIDRTFASLATSVILDEDRYGTQVAQLMASGPSMSRLNFASSLTGLIDEGRSLLERAQILGSPRVGHNIQETLIDVTITRVHASETLLESVGSQLQLPGVAPASASLSALGSSLRRADTLWASARRVLPRQPGRARLPRSVFALSSAPLAAERRAISNSSSLLAQRSMTIDAVSVIPAALPAPSGHWVLLPSNDVSIGVAVHNQAYVDQSFVLHLSVTRANGASVAQQFVGRAGGFASVATTFSSLVFAPSEHATVKIWLSGTPVGANATGVRRYQVVVASSPAK